MFQYSGLKSEYVCGGIWKEEEKVTSFQRLRKCGQSDISGTIGVEK